MTWLANLNPSGVKTLSFPGLFGTTEVVPFHEVTYLMKRALRAGSWPERPKSFESMGLQFLCGGFGCRPLIPGCLRASQFHGPFFRSYFFLSLFIYWDGGGGGTDRSDLRQRKVRSCAGWRRLR